MKNRFSLNDKFWVVQLRLNLFELRVETINTTKYSNSFVPVTFPFRYRYRSVPSRSLIMTNFFF